MKTVLSVWTLTFSLLFNVAAFAQGATFAVVSGKVEDLKAVFATVESVDVVAARARLGGTLVELSVDEGVRVAAGQKIARVGDKKLALRMKSLDARYQSLTSQRDLAQTMLARLEKLFATGAIPKARLDEARSGLVVAERALAAAKADVQVLQQTRAEGDVLAPATGRILKVNGTQGAVVLPGESVATIAVAGYILRLQVPERHARFIQKGDKVRVAERGMGALTPQNNANVRSGRIIQVYPEIKQGRVTADVAVDDLGDFFVGERIRVWIGTGVRDVLIVPKTFLYHRYGLTYVKLNSGFEVVVQPGLPQVNGIEILSGLNAGDVLVLP